MGGSVPTLTGRRSLDWVVRAGIAWGLMTPGNIHASPNLELAA
jgi:hypothetical protein